MPLFRHNDKIVFFVHIPKTGGTSIEDTMSASGVKVALRTNTRFRGMMRTTFQHINAEVYNMAVPADFYDYAFAITRHPIARLISEFYYRRKRGASRISFDLWVNMVIDRYTSDPYAIDNHLRPQVDFLSENVEIFKIEDGIEAPLQRAAEVLGITLKQTSPRANVTAEKHPVTWTNLTRQRVMDLYDQDFRTLGYDPDQHFDDISIGKPDVMQLLRQRPGTRI